MEWALVVNSGYNDEFHASNFCIGGACKAKGPLASVQVWQDAASSRHSFQSQNRTPMTLDRSKVFPGLTQHGILDALGTKPYQFWDLGPRVTALLWEDLGNATRAITPGEATAWAGSESEAVAIAMANLDKEIYEGRLLFGVAELPLGGKCGFFDQHWLAGATLMHNGLLPWISQSLGTDQVMALVPSPESIAYFAADCTDEVREAVELFALKAGEAARKPLGRNLYRFVDGTPEIVD